MADNTIIVETEDLGEFVVLLSDEQISIIAENGADYLENVKDQIVNISYQDEEPQSSYWMPDQIGTEDTDDGFTGNEIDWTSYFPEISHKEIEDLIADAERREMELRLATTAGLVFLSVGLTAALGGNPLPASVGFVQVLEVAGEFFKKEERPIETDEIGG